MQKFITKLFRNIGSPSTSRSDSNNNWRLDDNPIGLETQEEIEQRLQRQFELFIDKYKNADKQELTQVAIRVVNGLESGLVDAQRLQVLSWLVKKGADVNANQNELLFALANSVYLPILKLAVAKGADLKQANKHGESLLTHVLTKTRIANNCALLCYLLNEGLDIPDEKLLNDEGKFLTKILTYSAIDNSFAPLKLIMESLVIKNREVFLRSNLFHMTQKNGAWRRITPQALFMPGLDENKIQQYQRYFNDLFGTEDKLLIVSSYASLAEYNIIAMDGEKITLQKDDAKLEINWVHIQMFMKKDFVSTVQKEFFDRLKEHAASKTQYKDKYEEGYYTNAKDVLKTIEGGLRVNPYQAKLFATRGKFSDLEVLAAGSRSDTSLQFNL